MKSLSIFFCLATLFANFTHAQSTPPDADNIRASLCSTIGPVIKQTDGLITPEVRSTYLDWATNVIFTELSAGNKTVPDDCLAEVWADPDLRDAMYRSVFPPDPSILQNYSHWRAKLGPAFLEKYRSLVIAFSVAKSVNRVEANEDMDNVSVSFAEHPEKYGRDSRGNYQPAFWGDGSLHRPKNQKEKAYIAAIADFMKDNHVAAIDLYQSPELQSKLVAFLTDRNIARNLISEVKRSVQFGEYLKNAMVILGQRPGDRETKPDTESWMRYLVSIYEATPSSVPTVDGKPKSWPIFPLSQAPWPLLMPLAHAVPLGEARYMWEAYQGEHGPDRFHTYGPYRGDADAMRYELQPSKWFWDAWPDRIVHGGECVPLSKSTVDFYCGLGKPAVWAGQPGHANLITFDYVNGAWLGDVEQAFAGGPDVTYAQWYFPDDFKTSIRFRHLYFWAGAEYHLGLALGMNCGLRSYLDTRMAANIFKLMQPDERPALGKKLLGHAVEANPFNPDLWYRLAMSTPDESTGMTLVQSMMKHTPDDSGYWQTTEKFAAQFCIMDRPAPQTEEELRSVCQFLQSIPGMKFEEVESYAVKFYQSLADKNDPYGEQRMGERYLEGMGVHKDENKAREYFAKAIAQGNKDAVHELELLNATVPVTQITVTPSSQFGSDQDVRNLINGKGLLRGFHDNNGSAQTMWHSVSRPSPQSPAHGLPPSPAWVKFDFDEPKKLASILVWNHNQSGLTDRGFKETDIWGSADGVTWFRLTSSDTIVLPRASGQPGLGPITIPTADTHEPVQSVIIAATATNGNYGSDIYGLSAVRFLTDPKATAARSIQAN